MKWFFRPSSLLVVSAALALSAVALVLWPRPVEDKADPLPVHDGDQEIVWLYAATSPGPWERFIKGVETVVETLPRASGDPVIVIDKQSAFPAETTTVPEVVLSAQGTKGRLRFRWYKLTSDLKTQDWIQALLERRPAPLAIIGGSSSDLGIALAESLHKQTAQRGLGATAPLLLFTMATADDDPDSGDQPLTSIYGGRTYRFCFTNRQMAEAVVDFIWGQPDLRPDGDPVWLAWWKDDPYSKDLGQRYLEALAVPAARGAAQDWARFASYAIVGGAPFDGLGVAWGQFRLGIPAAPAIIPYSVGTFGRPNRWEVVEGGRLMEQKLREHPQQRRPLLVLPAATQPARRFLRALVRFAPVEARQFVVATGDAIAFNTIYRDRNFAWPIQDLPFSVVFFCHRNPVDPGVGFPLENGTRAAELGDTGPSPPGTEDLLLYVDILDALIQASFSAGVRRVSPALPANADELKSRLSQARWWKEGGRVSFDPANAPLFDDQGNRRSGTGEHIVTLQPVFEAFRSKEGFQTKEVLPTAHIEVWAWEARGSTGERHWRRQATLPVRYDGYQESDLEGVRSP
jgi:hypothetical protein